jgi:hypothetical protein
MGVHGGDRWVITGEVSGCQPREGYPIERPCSRLFARFELARRR